MVVHASDTSTGEAEVGEPGLHCKFEANATELDPVSKQNKTIFLRFLFIGACVVCVSHAYHHCGCSQRLEMWGPLELVVRLHLGALQVPQVLYTTKPISLLQSKSLRLMYHMGMQFPK